MRKEVRDETETKIRKEVVDDGDVFGWQNYFRKKLFICSVEITYLVFGLGLNLRVAPSIIQVHLL